MPPIRPAKAEMLEAATVSTGGLKKRVSPVYESPDDRPRLEYDALKERFSPA